MKAYAGLSFLLGIMLSSSLFAAELSVVTDPSLVELLNNFEILTENKQPPYAIRVIRVREHGECDGAPPRCPQAMLYVAVSTFDEAPDQKVYSLPKADGWEFVRWKTLPKHEGQESFAVFEVEEKIASASRAKDSRSRAKYEVHINPWKGYLKPVQGRSKP